MAKGNMKAGDLYAGLTRSNPKADSGMRPTSASVNSNPTRDKVGSASSMGGREA